MRRMGIQALYRKPNTSKKHPAHPVFPYLLRGLAIERANQVWALDITYIPMARGWVYLVAVLDWAQPPGAGAPGVDHDGGGLLRRGLARGRGALGSATDRQHRPGQPVQQRRVRAEVAAHRRAQSMDGKGCWRDNVFVERLWRSVKYEEVYLKAYDSVSAARHSLARYFEFYNARRPHQSHDGQHAGHGLLRNAAADAGRGVMG
jgi:putative transposase